jgi:phospholipid-translocating ATPase
MTQDLDIKQFIHRGTMVVNSGHIDALVVYTGNDTKIVLNQGKYIFKYSHLEKAINLITLWNMFVIFFLALIMTLNYNSFLNKWSDSSTQTSGAYYLFYGSPKNLAFKVFGSYYLLFNQFIPFELIIIIEMMKIWYTAFIQRDIILHNVDEGKVCMV